MSWPMAFIQGRSIFKPSIKYVKGYEKSSHKVCIFCAETVKENVQLLPNIFFMLKIVWLPLETLQCFLMTVRLLLKDINERLLLKENVQLIFFCVWLLLETFQCFLMNVQLLLKRY